MKNYLLILGIIAMMSQTAYAHPPSSINAGYTASSGTLSVVVSHPVRSAKRHYIDKIKIKKDGEVIEEKAFASQSDLKTQEAEFILEGVDPEDTIVIEAYCNISGRLGRKISFD